MTELHQAEHEKVMFRNCSHCIGGRVFWSKAEPQWQAELGYVGICAMCGQQWFTWDLLGHRPARHVRGNHLPSRYIGGVKTAA